MYRTSSILPFLLLLLLLSFFSSLTQAQTTLNAANEYTDGQVQVPTGSVAASGSGESWVSSTTTIPSAWSSSWPMESSYPLSSTPYTNPFTSYTSMTNSLGVVTGMPSVVTSQPAVITSQPLIVSAVTTPVYTNATAMSSQSEAVTPTTMATSVSASVSSFSLAPTTTATAAPYATATGGAGRVGGNKLGVVVGGLVAVGAAMAML